MLAVSSKVRHSEEQASSPLIKGEPYVCLVTTNSSKVSCPKGGLEPGEDVPTGATREWCEETDLSPSKFVIETSRWVDDGGLGVRYFIGTCDDVDPEGGELDRESTMWKPTREDPTDLDAVYFAMWHKLTVVL